MNFWRRGKEMDEPNLLDARKRIVDHGEVFTSEKEVKAMLDLVKLETERIDSRFLEPACGDGNFLIEVLKRKLNTVNRKYSKSQLEWERYAVIAISSIYGVDILEDNSEKCRQRLYQEFEVSYVNLFNNRCKEDCKKSVKYILSRNILSGDALDFTNPYSKEPIVFSEWTAVTENMIKRRDYVFKFLVEKSHQFKLFNDEGQPAAIDEPVKDFPLIHFLKLWEK